MNIDVLLQLLAKLCENRHQPVDREPAEIGFADAGEISGSDAGDFLRGAHHQLALVQHANDLGRKQGTKLFPSASGWSRSRNTLPLPRIIVKPSLI